MSERSFFNHFAHCLGNRLDPGDFPILEFRTLPNIGLPDLVEQLRRLLAFINH